jgi:hypothetical protein
MGEQTADMRRHRLVDSGGHPLRLLRSCLRGGFAAACRNLGDFSLSRRSRSNVRDAHMRQLRIML